MKVDDVTKNVSKHKKVDRFDIVVINPTTTADKAPERSNDLFWYPLADMYSDTTEATVKRFPSFRKSTYTYVK